MQLPFHSSANVLEEGAHHWEAHRCLPCGVELAATTARRKKIRPKKKKKGREPSPTGNDENDWLLRTVFQGFSATSRPGVVIAASLPHPLPPSSLQSVRPTGKGPMSGKAKKPQSYLSPGRNYRFSPSTAPVPASHLQSLFSPPCAEGPQSYFFGNPKPVRAFINLLLPSHPLPGPLSLFLVHMESYREQPGAPIRLVGIKLSMASSHASFPYPSSNGSASQSHTNYAPCHISNSFLDPASCTDDSAVYSLQVLAPQSIHECYAADHCLFVSIPDALRFPLFVKREKTCSLTGGLNRHCSSLSSSEWSSFYGCSSVQLALHPRRIAALPSAHGSDSVAHRHRLTSPRPPLQGNLHELRCPTGATDSLQGTSHALVPAIHKHSLP